MPFTAFYFQYLVEVFLESHQVKEFLSFSNRFFGATVCLDYWRANFHVKMYFVFLFSDF